MELQNALSGREQNLVLFILALSTFMASLDSTIVNISLPAIAASFGVSLSMVSWVAIELPARLKRTPPRLWEARGHERGSGKCSLRDLPSLPWDRSSAASRFPSGP